MWILQSREIKFYLIKRNFVSHNRFIKFIFSLLSAMRSAHRNAMTGLFIGDTHHVRFLAQNRSCSLRSSEETHRTWHHLHRCAAGGSFFSGNRIRDTSPCRFYSLSVHINCARLLIFVCRILSSITREKRQYKRLGGKITISLSTRIAFKE